MAIAQAMCNAFKKELMLGTHNFATNGNAFKLALYAEGGGGKSSTTATLGFGTTVYTTTGEVANSGSYTAGGGTLTKVAPSVATSTSTATAFTATITNASAGEITISLTDTQTTALEAGRFVYDVLITASGGAKTRVVEGQVTVNPSVTR